MSKTPKELRDDFHNFKYIIISCEGAAELEIMNLLLKNARLLFSQEQIIAVTNYRKAEDIQENYLMRDYDGDVLLLRIIDSRNEKFHFKKPYDEKCKVVNINTVPEIEMLVIIYYGKYDEYSNKYKTRNKKKPSDYCKQDLGIKDVKKQGYITNLFNDDVDRLIQVLREYARVTKRRDMLFISDMLNS